MKLAVVTAYPPSKINLSEYAYHLIKHFAQKEEIDELILLTDITDEPKDLSFSTAGCWVKVKQCWYYNNINNLFLITKAIYTTKPNAVLFNMQFMKFGDNNANASLGLLLPLICRMKKIATVVLLHNILEQDDIYDIVANNKLLKKTSTLSNTLLTRMILKADSVVLTNQKNIDIYKSKYKATNLTLIPHGSYEVTEEPNTQNKEDVLRVTAYGSFGKYKKIETLIAAVEIIRKRTNLTIEILIAGTDDTESVGYLNQMKERYKNVKQLRFTGHVEAYEVPAIFKKSTVVIFPYVTNVVCMHYLYNAFGYAKAVAMPNYKNLEDLVVEEGYKGAFFTPEDSVSMANVLEKILVDNEYREEIQENNYNVAKAHPMDKVTDMYLATFKNIMHTKAFA